MREVTLDGKDFDNISSIHNILKQKLQLPHYYGENLNALWDCLVGWIDMPIKIKWINFSISKKNVGDFADELLQVFQDAEEEIEGFHFQVSD